MAVYNISVPEGNTIDALAEAREHRDALVRAQMSRKAYRDAIVQGLQAAMDDIGNPVAELSDTLFQCPIRDAYDYRSFVNMRDSRRLGASLLKIIADASLASYEATDTFGF